MLLLMGVGRGTRSQLPLPPATPSPRGQGSLPCPVCLSICLSLLPPFPSLLPFRIVNMCDLEDAILHFCLPLIKAPCSIQ